MLFPFDISHSHNFFIYKNQQSVYFSFTVSAVLPQITGSAFPSYVNTAIIGTYIQMVRQKIGFRKTDKTFYHTAERI